MSGVPVGQFTNPMFRGAVNTAQTIDIYAERARRRIKRMCDDLERMMRDEN